MLDFSAACTAMGIRWVSWWQQMAVPPTLALQDAELPQAVEVWHPLCYHVNGHIVMDTNLFSDQ